MSTKLSVDQVLTKASSHVKRDEILEAEKLYQSVLLAFPQNIRAQQGLATLSKLVTNNANESPPKEKINQLISLYNKGKLSAVVEQAKILTYQYPKAFIIWNIVGVAFISLEHFDRASEAFKKVIELNPKYADAYYNMGNALKAQGKLDEAIEAYKQCIILKPDHAEAYNNLGKAFQEQEKLDDAIEAYNNFIMLNPDYPETYNNMGNTFNDKGNLDEAIEFYKKAVLLKPDYAEAYNNMGVTLKDQGKLEEAIEAYNKAISLKPDYAEVYNNIGMTHQYQGKLEDAIDAYKKAISLKPDYAQAHKNLTYVLLNSGHLQEGLDEYEWRWKTDKFLLQQRDFSQPLWDGKESLHGKRILLWCEQGIGDTINWSSSLSLISSQAKYCVLECQEKLVPLFKRSFPNIDVKTENRSLDSERDDFDVHLPMGSLYKHFFEEITQKTKAEAFLIPDPVRVKFWRKRLNSLGKGPYIGISWKSSIMTTLRGPNYSSISEWCPILKISDVNFINMQYVDFENDLNKIKNEHGYKIHNFDDLDHFNNIDDVAALCAALDMVVSNKTTVPLISAAVGTATKLANWRQSSWSNILHNPVGPTLDIVERDTWEPWDNVFNLIADDVVKLSND